jgi:hypothetical protein
MGLNLLCRVMRDALFTSCLSVASSGEIVQALDFNKCVIEGAAFV